MKWLLPYKLLEECIFYTTNWRSINNFTSIYYSKINITIKKKTRASVRIKNFEDAMDEPSTSYAEVNTDTNDEQYLQYKLSATSIENEKKKDQTNADLESMKDLLQQLEDPPLTQWEKNISSSRLPYSFYDCPCETLAKNILGKVLVRKLDDGTILKGRIVETESYLGFIDKASATYEGKVTPHNIPMYMIPGTIFVYLTYGMYHCFNISSQESGSSIFLRAVEPIQGIERMKHHRNSTSNSKVPKKVIKNFKPYEICNGPSKLCMAFDIKKQHSKYSMCSWKGMWIEEDSKQEEIKIISCPRVGIDSAGPEWASKPLRFYIFGNRFVSKRDKKAESKLQINL